MLKMDNLIAFEVIGNAMAPSIPEGEIVHVNPDIVPISNGKDIGVFIIGDSLHVARYTRYGSKFILLHENAPHSVVPVANVEILGKVIESETFPINEENHSAGNTAVFKQLA